jgi:NADPH:quinone reductase-like Zn-dependent oxidoreductase
VLEWSDVPTPEPSASQIRIKVRVSGVGPTDLKIRRGDLDGAFPLPQPAVLGFETAGTVDALGSEVADVAVGDEVAAWLPSLGGYGEYALAAAWTPKPSNVSWSDAGALPASVEAAIGVLRRLGVARGETLLILGAVGSVGVIATQLALRQGVTVIGAVGAHDARGSSASSGRRRCSTAPACSPASGRSATESMRRSMPRAKAAWKTPSP